jgi:hypothetical protein
MHNSIYVNLKITNFLSPSFADVKANYPVSTFIAFQLSHPLQKLKENLTRSFTSTPKSPIFCRPVLRLRVWCRFHR